MSGMSAKKPLGDQGKHAYGQVQNQAQGAGDMLQGMRMGGPLSGRTPGGLSMGNLMGGLGMGGYGKVMGDVGAEGQRTFNAFRDDPWTASLDRFGLTRYRPGGHSLGEDRHKWNMQGDKRYAGNERDKERAADQRGQQAALEQRQQMMAGGIGGGGAQFSAEIQRYNQILAEYAQQQQAFKQQGLQGDMEMIRMLAMLFGGG